MNSAILPLAPILRAVSDVSDDSFSFRGERYSFASAAEAEARLCNLLYERCYMRRIDSPPIVDGDGTVSFLEPLRAANAARPRWQTGWLIDRVHNSGWISAQRDGLRQTFAPGEFITREGPGMPLRVGAIVDVYLAVASEYMQPGFYFAFGETVVDESESGSLVRFYWHLQPAGAPLLLQLVSILFNRFQAPYRFKCLVHPAAYIRADSAVVFVPSRWYQIAARLLSDVRREIASYLRADSPLFTKPLADGLALAEDPGGRQSFGMHRCAALARAIREAAATDGAATSMGVEAALARQGVSPQFPYLNPGSVDIYDFAA